MNAPSQNPVTEYKRHATECIKRRDEHVSRSLVASIQSVDPKRCARPLLRVKMPGVTTRCPPAAVLMAQRTHSSSNVCSLPEGHTIPPISLIFLHVTDVLCPAWAEGDTGASDNVSIVAGSRTKATQRLGRNTTRGRVCEAVIYEKN